MMAGTLFVVATPIGNLDDITVRALRVLREVSLVAAEDTRRSGNLLRHFGITTRVLSLHAHNERSRAPQILARLQQEESVAVVSDAGTPGISDPGAELVRLARQHAIRVEAIPGPSAVSAAISVAGLQDAPFSFVGFPPTRSKDRKEWWARFTRLHRDAAVVCFEAPHRITRTLLELSKLVEHPITLLREVTKMHEETLIGLPADLVSLLSTPQGEFTLVVPPAAPAHFVAANVAPEVLRAELAQLTRAATSKRDAARLVASKFGLTTKLVYDATKTNGPTS